MVRRVRVSHSSTIHSRRLRPNRPSRARPENLDVPLGRDFRVAGDKRPKVRLAVFNAANTVHLGAPNTVVDVPA